jgi:myo-inositol 2-dehydrogenase/D-chiro-inositol 1-dehydrogenase/scyllo-inositol 2-dehydrogenase (NAD+)
MQKKEIGICLIGAGRAGMIHAKNFKNKVSGAYMAAVVDADEKTVKAASSELGDIPYFTDYKDILKKDEINAVIVVAPTNLHKQIVVDCAKAGKHVFCEKPMAMDTEQCDEMIRACSQNNVKLQIGFMRRHDESFMRAKDMIQSGAIGEVVMIRSCTRGPSKPRPWMYDIRKSNGILAELNSHDIDCIRWLAESEFKTIFATGGNYRNKEIAGEYPDYYDNMVMNGVMENGIQYSIDGAAYVQYGYDAKVEILGTKGVLQVGRSDAQFLKCTTVENGTSTPFITSWMTLFKEAYLEEDARFIDCIIHDKPPKVTGLDGKMAVKIVEMGNRSIAGKKLIEL